MCQIYVNKMIRTFYLKILSEFVDIFDENMNSRKNIFLIFCIKIFLRIFSKKVFKVINLINHRKYFRSKIRLRNF